MRWCVLLTDCIGEPIGSDLARSNHEASLLTIQRLFGWVSIARTDSKTLLVIPISFVTDHIETLRE